MSSEPQLRNFLSRALALTDNKAQNLENIELMEIGETFGHTYVSCMINVQGFKDVIASNHFGIFKLLSDA